MVARSTNGDDWQTSDFKSTSDFRLDSKYRIKKYVDITKKGRIETMVKSKTMTWKRFNAF